MFTLRPMPAASGRRAHPESPNALLSAYRQGLWQHWRWSDRLIARLLGLIWRDGGWSTDERAILSDEVRRRGLSQRERKGLHRLLSPGAFPLRSNALKNKALFDRTCRAAGLPVPATYHRADGDLGRWLEGCDDVIAKPSYSSKGRGILRFTREGAGWRSVDGLLSEEELLTKLDEIDRREGVIQHCLAPHGDLQSISPGALPTLRVVTCRDEMGEPEACFAGLRLSAGAENPVDNFNAGNLAVPIDEAGRCQAADMRVNGRIESVGRHPATNSPIAGQPVPDLDTSNALACLAHRAFPGFLAIGWDIGLSDRGPVLIEGNWNPGTTLVQRVEGRGLDESRLGALYRHHLAAVPEARWRGARPIQLEPR